MKTLKLTFSIVCAALLLLAGQVYGQKRDKYDVIPPQKGNNAKEQAAELSKQGWNAHIFTIEEQLASTWKLMCEMQSNNESRYLWAKAEVTTANEKDAIMENFIQCSKDLTYQVQLPFISQCRIIMMQKGNSGDQIAAMEKIVRQITPMVIQNNSKKSLELYKEKDKQVSVQTVFIVDKTNLYDILLKECINYIGDNKDFATLEEVFNEAIHRMAKKNLR